VPPVGLGAPGNTNGSAPGPVGGRNGRTGDCARTVKPAELHAGREHYGTLRLRLRLGTNFVLVRYRPDEIMTTTPTATIDRSQSDKLNVT
jgi:hypothetical protein